MGFRCLTGFLERGFRGFGVKDTSTLHYFPDTRHFGLLELSGCGVEGLGSESSLAFFPLRKDAPTEAFGILFPSVQRF